MEGFARHGKIDEDACQENRGENEQIREKQTLVSNFIQDICKLGVCFIFERKVMNLLKCVVMVLVNGITPNYCALSLLNCRNTMILARRSTMPSRKNLYDFLYSLFLIHNISKSNQ